LFALGRVDVINAFGNTSGIGPFYVSFIITPMASNASEVLSAILFAGKKTKKGYCSMGREEERRG